MNGTIDICPRKKQLKEEYERLQLEYAAMVVSVMSLGTCSRYMENNDKEELD